MFSKGFKEACLMYKINRDARAVGSTTFLATPAPTASETSTTEVHVPKADTATRNVSEMNAPYAHRQAACRIRHAAYDIDLIYRYEYICNIYIYDIYIYTCLYIQMCS